MSKMKASAVATIIGDVIGSRLAQDRPGLQQQLTTALDEVGTGTAPVQALRMTVGDEFQGAYATVGDAISAALAVRLALPQGVDVRFGIGWGLVEALDETTQDGPGWWAAREAIVAVKEEESKPATALVRTLYRSGGPHGPAPAAVNAALRCRDQMMGSLDDRSIRILRALMSGDSQATIASDEGISPSAVSQRVRAGGLGVLVLAQSDLARVS